MIDREQLAKMYPDEAEDDRYLIPERHVGTRKAVLMVGYPCVAGFVLNATVIGCFMERRGTQNTALEAAG